MTVRTREEAKDLIRKRFSDVDDLNSWRFMSAKANAEIDEIDITIREKSGGLFIKPYTLVGGYKVIGISNEFLIGREEKDNSIILFDSWESLLREDGFQDIIIEKIKKWVEMRNKLGEQ